MWVWRVCSPFLRLGKGGLGWLDWIGDMVVGCCGKGGVD